MLHTHSGIAKELGMKCTKKVFFVVLIALPEAVVLMYMLEPETGFFSLFFSSWSGQKQFCHTIAVTDTATRAALPAVDCVAPGEIATQG